MSTKCPLIKYTPSSIEQAEPVVHAFNAIVDAVTSKKKRTEAEINRDAALDENRKNQELDQMSNYLEENDHNFDYDGV